MKTSSLAGLLAYGAFATAVAYGLPQMVAPDLLITPSSAGIVAGVLIFLFCALIHESAARRSDQREIRRLLVDLNRVLLRPRGGKDGGDVANVVAEMKMLKSLVEQLGPPQEPSTAEPRGLDTPRTQTRPLSRPPEKRPEANPEPPTLRVAKSDRVVFDSQDNGEEIDPFVFGAPAGGVGGPATEPTLPVDTNSALLDAVREALSADRVELYLQPIVSLPQRKARHYQCHAAIQTADGEILQPDRYRPVAEQAGLMATIDNMLLVRCIQLVRRARRSKNPVGFFCNISGDTLRDREFFSDFLTFMRDNSDLAGHLMFALTQHEIYRMDIRTETELGELARIGFRFAMTETANLDLFVADLSQKGFRFVKVAAPVLIAKLPPEGDPRALKRALDPGAIDLIVDHIDTEAELLDLLDYGIDFGQGLLFGEPRPEEYR